MLIVIYFLVELGKITDGYVFEHLETTKISTIKKLFPKIKTIKVFNFKTREPIKRNEIIKDIQEFDKQLFEKKAKKLIYCIVSNINFPEIKIKFVRGINLLKLYPNGTIPLNDHVKFFN